MSWIDDLQGIVTIEDADGEALERRKTLRVTCAVADDGERTVIFPDGPIGVTGATAGPALESLIAALVTQGLITDDR
jgi:hypothetical protein